MSEEMKEKEEESQQEATSQEDDLAFTDLSDADLDAELTKSQGGDEDEKGAEDETEGEEEKAEGDAEEEAEEKTDEEPSELEKLQKQVADLTTELENVKEHSDEQEQFIKRQATEIGDLRKEKTEKFDREFKERLPGENVDAIREVVKFEESIREEERDLERKGKERAQKEAQVFVRSKISNIDNLLPEMAAILKDEGVKPEMVDNFLRNPWESATDFIITLARRTESVIENRELKKQIEELEKKQEDVIDKIEEASKKKQKITGGAGDGQEKKKLTDISFDDLSDMPDAELEKLLEEQQKQ